MAAIVVVRTFPQRLLFQYHSLRPRLLIALSPSASLFDSLNKYTPSDDFYKKLLISNNERTISLYYRNIQRLKETIKEATFIFPKTM